MKLGLRTKLIGTLVGAIVISSAISAVAARNTMAVDLNRLASQQITSGSTGFAGYVDQKRDTVKMLVTQAAINEAVQHRTAIRSKKLEATLNGIARQGNLSFLTIVDWKGNVLARANGGPPGARLRSPLVDRALQGETLSTATTLSHEELVPEQLLPQIESTMPGYEGPSEGLGIVAAAPIADANDRTIGAVYGGIVVDHFYDIVDQAANALGGKAAVIFKGDMISSSLTRPDGTRLVDTGASPEVANATQAFSAIDREGGVDYLARVEPVFDDQMHVVALRWFGVPLSNFTAIQNHTLISLLIWGLVGIVLGLALALPVIERIARRLVERSRQLRKAAQELSVVIVGSEVSGDHVAQTREAVERQGDLLMQVAMEATGSLAVTSGSAVAVVQGVSEKILAASALNAEILSDVVVIDTLATEMAGRTQHAVERVHELDDVAAGLAELVTGSRQ
jgi:hypothetical protein